ncbi:MAG: flippase [Limnospira sp.]
MGNRRSEDHNLRAPAGPSFHLGALARGAGVAFAVQVSGMGLTYFVHVLLAGRMGTAEFGIYEFVLASTLLLSVLAQLGFPTAVLRLISQYRVTGQWGHLAGLIRGSWRLSSIAGMSIGLLVTVILGVSGIDRVWIYSVPLQVGVWMVPLFAIAQLQSEIARALQKVALAYVPFRLLWPFLVAIGTFGLLAMGVPLTGVCVLQLSLLTLAIAIGVQLVLLRRTFEREFPPASPVYRPREWLRVALPLLLQGVFFIVLSQTDILMLGSMVGPDAVGIYSAAAKTALWSSFVLQAVNTVVAPVFATLYARTDRGGLQSLVATVAHWIFWPSLILAIALIRFAPALLGLFGPEFVAGRWPMTVLILGQLINVGSGSVGYLMVMTGHQDQSALIFGGSALANLILNAIAIPFLGILGAAIATATCMAIWNVVLHILVVRYLKIYPSIIFAFWKPVALRAGSGE